MSPLNPSLVLPLNVISVCLLQYLSRCDKVMLMQCGRIVEMGSHSELLEADKDYADLMSLYYSKYEQIQKDRIKSAILSREGRYI